MKTIYKVCNRFSFIITPIISLFEKIKFNKNDDVTCFDLPISHATFKIKRVYYSKMGWTYDIIRYNTSVRHNPGHSTNISGVPEKFLNYSTSYIRDESINDLLT